MRGECIILGNVFIKGDLISNLGTNLFIKGDLNLTGSCLGFSSIVANNICVDDKLSVLEKVITTNGSISAKSIAASTNISSYTNIHSDSFIDSNYGEITAKGEIIAKDYIRSGGGISSYFSITTKGTLSAQTRILAGIASHRIPHLSERKITCSKLLGGTVSTGDLVETNP